jgi:hypothetical protein
VSPAPPEELLWWHRTLFEVLDGRGGDCRASLLSELRTLSQEVGAYLSGSRG